jgi:ppGpp synthetase/RelA/SpoT-type nucleotidyltranferase
MASLDFADIASIQRDLLAQKSTYESLSDYMLSKLLLLKSFHPKTIRVVFSRQPKVKDVNGIIRKMALIRAKKKNASIKDVNDVIALTILCPYESDILQIAQWVGTMFEVSPPPEEAVRDAPDGHRGHHFSLRLPKRELHGYADFRGLSCELQIKTILQEAFDAKSHDLAYKPGNLEVGEELKTQFVHLSRHLSALDGQSEFVKDLILREKREVELRRRACLQMYMSNCGDIPERLGVDLARLPALADLMDMLDRPDIEISKDMCKFVAYCATSFDNDYLAKLAIEMVEQYVEKNPTDPRRLFGRGALHWTLGYHELALNDMLTVISESEGDPREEQAAANREAKNNFIYFTCDWQVFSSGVPEETKRMAAEFAQAISPGLEPEELDSLGLYQIVFSDSVEEIDRGRRQLSDSLARRTANLSIYQTFFDLHQFIAINRMLKLMTKPTR